MKKLFIALALLSFTAPLTGCQLLSSKNQSDDSTFKINQTRLQHNSQHWQNKIDSARIETQTIGSPGQYSLIPTSVDELKKYNPLLIKGTVFNLEPMKNCRNEAYTKVSVFVDQVLKGNKKTESMIINFNLNSGFIFKPQQDEFNYIKKTEVPMPEIGSKIITGLTPRKIDPTKKDPITKFFVENQSADHLSYSINDPIHSFWIKKNNQADFQLNNPLLNQQSKDDWYAKKLLNLTEQLNHLKKQIH